MNISTAYTYLYSAALVYLAILMAVMLMRAICVPGVANRLIATNMIGTMVNAAILILSSMLKESWLIDVALIYTMISFVTVLILTRVIRPPVPDCRGAGELPVWLRDEPSACCRTGRHYGPDVHNGCPGGQRTFRAGMREAVSSADIPVDHFSGINPFSVHGGIQEYEGVGKDMELIEICRILLLVLLLGCVIGVNLARSLLQSVLVFMAYSSVMCVLWILMESPDLAITEAAVGAGVSGMLFLLTLKKLREIDRKGGEKS